MFIGVIFLFTIALSVYSTVPRCTNLLQTYITPMPNNAITMILYSLPSICFSSHLVLLSFYMCHPHSFCASQWSTPAKFGVKFHIAGIKHIGDQEQVDLYIFRLSLYSSAVPIQRLSLVFLIRCSFPNTVYRQPEPDCSAVRPQHPSVLWHF